MQVPTEYFLRVLGRHLKYSCCLYSEPSTSLDDAEEAMLGVSWALGRQCLSLLVEMPTLIYSCGLQQMPACRP